MTIPDHGTVRLPAEMLQALMPAMKAMGITPPDASSLVPSINLGTPVRELGMQIGQLLRKEGLFRYGPERKLIIFEDGYRVNMTPIKFCSWIEKHVKVVKTYKAAGGGSYDAEVSMGKDLAGKLLETHELLRELPRLEAILGVRTPVRRSDGAVELCEPGWDERAHTYCMCDLDYDLDWTLQRAVEFLERDMCGGFPFAERDKGRLWDNRSFLVHLSAMVGMYARRLLPPGTVRPLVFYMANDQGSGKSLLVSMVLSGCFGMAASTDLPLGSKGVNPEKFTALLETVAQSMKEFLWLDDVPPNVWSNSLNRFITAPSHTGRKYGGNDELFEAEAVTQVFMTGNMVEATRDLMQRALVCELYLAVDSSSRHFEHEMTSTWLGAPEQRKGLLSAMWAFVRNWVERGMPDGTTRQSRATDWSRLVGGVLAAADIVADPFAKPELPAGGDRETEEWMQLLVALADDVEEWVADQLSKDYSVDTAKIVEVARSKKLLVDLVGSPDDKPLKGGELKKLGRRLAKYRGKEDLRTTKGRRFQFGKRKQSSNWVYPITWLDPWETANEGAGE